MQKRGIGKVYGWFRLSLAVLLLTSVHFPATVLAVTAGETSFLPTVPLLITAYKTNTSGKDISYVELYNSGDTLLTLEDFSIVDPDNGERQLKISSAYSGSLEPGKHVVAAKPGEVAGASFTIEKWSDTSLLAVTQIKKLRVDAAGYRSVEASLSAKDAERDMAMVRTYNSTSYSTAASPFVLNYREAPQATLFDDGLYAAPAAASAIKIVEIYPYSSDCSPFDTSVLCGDYIKLYNSAAQAVELDGLVLRTDSSSQVRTTSNTITLTGALNPGDYYTVWLTDTDTRLSLTNSGGYVWLEDMYGTVRYTETLAKYESAGTSLQGHAYALNDADNWEWTSTPAPAGVNVITPLVAAACEDGKYRNPETGRCRTLEETINALAACEEGYERNPTTNRCRKIATTSTSMLTPCNEGQIRNPETNRCRSIASEVADLLPCADGYERNPATNRCRKAATSEVLGAEYPVQPYNTDDGSAANWWIAGGVAALALGYAGWEWRGEIAAGFVKLRNTVFPGKH